MAIAAFLSKPILVLTLGVVCASVMAAEIKAPSVEVGDKWVYKGRRSPVVEDLVTRIEGDVITVQRTYDQDPSSMQTLTYTLEWNELSGVVASSNRAFKDSPAGTNFSFPLALGMEWKSEIKRSLPTADTLHTRESKVVAVEEVTVPAGTFKAHKVEVKTKWRSVNTDPYGNPRAQGAYDQTYWYVPEINRFVKHFEDGTSRLELIEYVKQGQ